MPALPYSENIQIEFPVFFEAGEIGQLNLVGSVGVKNRSRQAAGKSYGIVGGSPNVKPGICRKFAGRRYYGVFWGVREIANLVQLDASGSARNLQRTRNQ